MISKIKDPLNKSSFNDSVKYNHDNKEKISIEEIKNSKFYIYPNVSKQFC